MKVLEWPNQWQLTEINGNRARPKFAAAASSKETHLPPRRRTAATAAPLKAIVKVASSISSPV